MAESSQSFGLYVDPKAKIWQLSVGEQQRVEILLYRGTDILIMDEPTAVLAPQEIEELFHTLRSMTAQGKSLIFISHKLNEVMQVADRITVLRKGRVTAAGLDTASISTSELARLMVGFFLQMTPYAFTIIVLVLGSREAIRKRIGAPAALGVPYVRQERG